MICFRYQHRFLTSNSKDPDWCLFSLFASHYQAHWDIDNFAVVRSTLCRQVLHVHKSALYAQRNFWKVVLHNNVTFTALVQAFKRIESARTRADRTYQTVLERYPTNVKVRHYSSRRNHCWRLIKYVKVVAI